MHLYIHPYMHAYMYTRTYTYMYMCMYIYIYIYIDSTHTFTHGCPPCLYQTRVTLHLDKSCPGDDEDGAFTVKQALEQLRFVIAVYRGHFEKGMLYYEVGNHHVYIYIYVYIYTDISSVMGVSDETKGSAPVGP